MKTKQQNLDHGIVVPGFRLDPSRPQERRALDYLDAEIGKGRKRRDILAAALAMAAQADEINATTQATLQQILDQLQRLQAGGMLIAAGDDAGRAGPGLPDELKQSLLDLANRRPLNTSGE